MEELLIRVKNDEESSFIKDLLKKLHIQFETIHDSGIPSGEEIKQSVIKGQSAFKNGRTDLFTQIDRKAIWK
jgi:hypothetical protein